MTNVYRRFTADEDATIIEMVEVQKSTWATIGLKIDRRANVVGARYRKLRGRSHFTPAGDASREPIQSVEQISAKRLGPVFLGLLDDRAHLSTARSQRDQDELWRGNCTPTFFGDPPPGFSALDRKRAGA